MKNIALILLIGTTQVAVAQSKNSLSKSVEDNGKTLNIRIHGNVDNKPISYERTFDVKEMSKVEKEELQKRVMDSLGISSTPPPPPPPAPAVHGAEPPVPPAPPRGARTVAESGNDGASVETERVQHGDEEEYFKRVSWNYKTGELKLEYRFKENGQPKNYEKAYDVPGASQEKRKSIIQSFESSIGFPAATAKSKKA